MKNSMIEQRLDEYAFRISKMEKKIEEKDEEIAKLKMQLVDNDKKSLDMRIIDYNEEIASLNRRIQNLSDELYSHVANQVEQLKNDYNGYISDIEKRIQNLSDEIYSHVGTVNERRIKEIEAIKSKIWMTNFGFDSLVSELQLDIVEQMCPGNRQRLESLRDSHVGERCFIIGNGPSLVASDLDIIRERGIFSFASKGIYNIFGETAWRPDVWAASDLDYISMKKVDIQEMDVNTKLLCAQSLIRGDRFIDNALYFPFIQAERYPRSLGKDIIKGVHFFGTITGKLIEIAVYMGFKDIYLLGVDNDYPTKVGEDGLVKMDVSAKVHFSNEYFSSDEYKNESERIQDFGHALKYMNESYHDIAYYCKEMGVSVVNATRGGLLEDFERIPFEQVISG